ncbi:MAG: chorismate-binding protein [Flavobacteriaceae bacterium]
MFKELLQKTKKHYNNSLPFVLYRKPGVPEVKGIFQQDDRIYYTETFSESGFVFAPFDIHKKSILLKPDEVSSCNFSVPEQTSAQPVFPDPRQADKTRHYKLVAKGIHAIKNGPLRKVVLSRKISQKVTKTPFEVFQSLLSFYPTAFCYLWYHPKIGLWSGATPETLIVAKNGKFKTMALAATRRVTEGRFPDWGQKEKLEQAMVTEYIANALAEKADGIQTSEVRNAKAGNLWHLQTLITGDFSGSSLKTIIDALHPTPAVCGLPLQEALNFIQEYEQYDREYYTGFLGELHLEDHGEAHLFVNLRCLQIQQGEAIIYVGGGITEDSLPEQEWQETIDKSTTIARALYNSAE